MEQQISALYLSGAPNGTAVELLKKRGWRVEVTEDLSKFERNLREIREQKTPPDVVLLGGSVVGGEGSYWSELATRLGNLGVRRFVPFSADKIMNQMMVTEGPKLGVQMVNVLGESPHDDIFLEGGLGSLEAAIAGQRGPGKENLYF